MCSSYRSATTTPWARGCVTLHQAGRTQGSHSVPLWHLAADRSDTAAFCKAVEAETGAICQVVGVERSVTL